jgi:L-rhamnose-H+ transport protein
LAPILEVHITPILLNDRPSSVLSALAGTIWFLQFFFYGMGASKLSNGASSWILHMAFIIVIANLWGITLHEWRGVTKRTFAVVCAGIGVILVSVFLVGYGNSLTAR